MADVATLWLMASDGYDVLSLEAFIGRPSWMHRGACRGEDVRWFFGELGGNYAHAEALCARCPVRSECLEYAMASPELAGYWAGTSARERRRMRRRAS